MDRGEFIKDGFTCQRGANGGWSVFPLYGVEKAYFTSFTEMCDWLEDQHEGLVIGEMAKKHPMMEVPAGMVVENSVGPYPRAEPINAKPMQEQIAEFAKEALEVPHGLRLEPLAPGHFLVMRSPEKDADDE